MNWPTGVLDSLPQAGLVLGFVWWRINALEKKMDATFKASADDATEQRRAIKEFWTERWPRVEVLEEQVQSVRAEVGEVRSRVDRLHERLTTKGV